MKTSKVVEAARVRLAWQCGFALLSKRWKWVVAAGCAAAVSRILIWPLAESSSPLSAIVHTLVLQGLGIAVCAALLVVVGRRRAPGSVAAARAIDAALGVQEIVASGFAFERDDRGGPLERIVRRESLQRLEHAKLEVLLPFPRLVPTRRRTASAAVASAVALAVGSYDPTVVAALVTPPTSDEVAAVAALESSAEQLSSIATERSPDKPKGSDGELERSSKSPPAARDEILEKVREATRAANKADRRRALDKLAEIRSAVEARRSKDARLNEALRKIARDLSSGSEGPEGSDGHRAQRPSDELRLLAERTRQEGGPDSSKSDERILERLSRAASDAQPMASEGRSGARDAQDLLRKAMEALSRGDRASAASLMERAAEQMARLEAAEAKSAAEAKLMAKLLARTSDLERALGEAMLGRKGKDGNDGNRNGTAEGGRDGPAGSGNAEGGKESLRRALAARLLAMSGVSRGGGHQPDNKKAKRSPLDVDKSSHASSRVSESGLAIEAINGLGRGTPPPGVYRDVFPSYDARVEEGLADERIPMARRRAVRRYFELIRPDSEAGFEAR